MADEKKEKVKSVPERENLLLLGLVNLLQPALEIKIESPKYQRWIKGWDKVIEVSILNEGKVHVVIKDNQMKAAMGPAPREPDIVMEGEYETITNYLNGELDPILMFFDFVLLRKVRLVKGLDIKLSNLLSGNIFQQARDLYRIDKILKIK
jgi:putative sterol carrier protein